MLRFLARRFLPADNGPIATALEQPRRLLVVILQHQGASLRELRPILLQASQDGEVTLIDHGAAEALHVAGAGFLFLLRAAPRLLGGEGRVGKRERQQSESKKIFTHRVPSL